MDINDNLPQRKSPRAKWIEYNEGMFFITICTHHKKHYFGEIIDEEMHFSKIGKTLNDELENTSLHHPHIEVPIFVVMPNHFHSIVIIKKGQNQHADATRSVPTSKERLSNGINSDKRTLLSTYIGCLKAAVTRYAHTLNENFKWQSRYHDHAIRNINELNNISQYIKTNVAKWEHDCFY
jgi:REP element-mobilizing transposase RayT